MTGVSPDLLWGFLPKPVAVAIAVILAITYAIGEVTGKLNGPVSKLLDRRKERREEQAVGWRERDRRVEELERALETLSNQRDRRVEELEESLSIQGRRLATVLNQVASQQDELTMVHKLSDAQARAIRRHLEWDRRWIGVARDAGLDIPDPPPSLYVGADEE